MHLLEDWNAFECQLASCSPYIPYDDGTPMALEHRGWHDGDKLGIEVVPVDLRDAYAFGGGLHCSTADVYREGDLQDYFPKQ